MRKSLLIPILVIAAACAKHETPETPKPPVKVVHTGTFAYSSQGQPAPSEPPAMTGVDVGAAMPAYKASLVDGKPFDIASERGTVVFLNLWATWCGPCRGEIPELQAMHDKYASRGFKVVGVSLDDTGVDVVRQFATEHKMTYPIAYDPQGKLAELFQTSVVPTSVIVDRSGKIVWKKFGAVSSSDQSLTDALAKALDAKS